MQTKIQLLSILALFIGFPGMGRLTVLLCWEQEVSAKDRAYLCQMRPEEGWPGGKERVLRGPTLQEEAERSEVTKREAKS